MRHSSSSRKPLDLRAAALVVAGMLTASAGQAQSAWPSGPIRIVTPTPVGVGSDVFARLYGERLAKLLKTSVFVENKPGAASTLGTDTVAKAAANGQTLLFSTSLPLTTAPHLFAKLPYAAHRDFTPVAQLYRGGSFIVAGPAFGGRSLKDLVDSAKREPAAVSYASYGPGTTSHLGMELLQDAAGIVLNHIPYKQSAMPDLIGGQVQIGFEPPVSALPNIKAGKVKPLAYTGDKRSPSLPDVPTLAETYPGLDVFTWVGVWVPAGTPEAAVRQLRDAFRTINQDPEIVKALADAGSEPLATTPAQMSMAITNESEAMGKLIKAKNISLN